MNNIYKGDKNMKDSSDLEEVLEFPYIRDVFNDDGSLDKTEAFWMTLYIEKKDSTKIYAMWKNGLIMHFHRKEGKTMEIPIVGDENWNVVNLTIAEIIQLGLCEAYEKIECEDGSEQDSFMGEFIEKYCTPTKEVKSIKKK